MDMHAAYEAVRAHVGRTYRRSLGRLHERDLRRFALAVGVEPRGDEGAEAEIASPLYLSSVMGWDDGPPEAELRADGTAGDQLAGLPVEGLRLMGAGQSLEFTAPVTAGTDVERETTVRDVELKEGRSGPFLLIRIEHVFMHGGQPMVRCAETFIGR